MADKNKKMSFSNSKNKDKHKSSPADNAPILGDDFQIIENTPQNETAIKKDKKPKKPKKQKKKKMRKKGFWPTLWRTILSLFLVGVLSGVFTIGGFLFYVFFVVDSSIEKDLNNLALKYTSVLYAKNSKGEQVELTRLHGEENRVWADLKDMPEKLPNAFVAIEDERFYEHKGVDWKRTLGAFANTIFPIYSSQQGGSTITQQLIKNLTGDDSVSPDRKIREIARARKLEEKYPKSTIVECYLNTIHLGPSVDGVQVASAYYFDKDVSALSLREMACLAAITKNPTGYNPYKHLEENNERTDTVLKKMKEQGYITAEEYDKAIASKLKLSKNPSTVTSNTKKIETEFNSWFVDAAIEDSISAIMEMEKIPYKTAETKLYSGGYKIYTTVDLKIQEKMEKIFLDNDYFPYFPSDKTKVNGKRAQPQCAMTVTDYKGHIVGVVGGRGEKKGNRLLNRATDPKAVQQPGSAMKPIGAYAPAVEYNLITYASSMKDSPAMTLKGNPWPQNYSRTYSGTVSIPYALKKSINTIPVKLVKEMGVDKSYNFLKKNGITTLGEGDKNLSSLAIGGTHTGVTVKEMTGAYATFGSNGIHHEPTTITKITDKNDQPVWQYNEKGVRAMNSGTAGVMVELLRGVAAEGGTGARANFDNWPIYCKTGTTSDFNDLYFAGGTPLYCGAVWFGFDINESMQGIGTNPAMLAWRSVMRSIHNGKKKADFKFDSGTVYTRYCTSSGLIARDGCYSTSVGVFKRDSMMGCDLHSGGLVDAFKSRPSGLGGYYSGGSSSRNDDDDDDDDYRSYTKKATTKKNSSNNDDDERVVTTQKAAPQTQAPVTAPPVVETQAPVVETQAPDPENQ